MAHTVELNIARKELADALGDDYKLYLTALKQWFRRRITKEEFDLEARKFLAADNTSLHNRFLMAILNKCQSWASTHANKETTASNHSVGKDKLKKGKLKKKSRPIRATFEHRFQPVNPLFMVPPVMAKDPSEDNRPSFCVREATLPDKVMIHGRMFISAWDCGLDAVDVDAVKLVLASVEHLLKNILMAVFCRRHSYKLRENRFIHSFEANLSRPYIINSKEAPQSAHSSFSADMNAKEAEVPKIKYIADTVETELMHQYSGSHFRKPVLQPVSLYDVYEALQIDHHVIPSHCVYSSNMERLAARLWHPSHEELQQDMIHQQEEDIKQQLKSQINN